MLGRRGIMATAITTYMVTSGPMVELEMIWRFSYQFVSTVEELHVVD